MHHREFRGVSATEPGGEAQAIRRHNPDKLRGPGRLHKPSRTGCWLSDCSPHPEFGSSPAAREIRADLPQRVQLKEELKQPPSSEPDSTGGQSPAPRHCQMSVDTVSSV